jgi:hypothetical protein
MTPALLETGTTHALNGPSTLALRLTLATI